jgi:outer membrane protein
MTYLNQFMRVSIRLLPDRIVLLCCLILAPVGPIRAETNTLRPAAISLRECVETALVRNRAVQIERLNPEIARSVLSGSYGYYDPLFTSLLQRDHLEDTGGFDPADFSRDAIYSANSEVASGGLTGMLPSGLSYSLMGSYAHSDGIRNSLDFDSYKLVTGIAARQPLLRDFWTDQGRTEIRVNKKLLKISELGLSYVIMDTINQVQQAYFELQFAIENLAVRHRLLATKQATLAGVQRQVEVGTLTALEEKLALSEVARVQAGLVTASNTVQQTENVLRTLLGHTITNWREGPLEPTGRLLVVPEPLQLAASWQRGLEQRPDLAQMKHDLERAGIELRFRRNQLYPFLNLVAAYGRRGASATQTVPPTEAEASLSTAFDQIGDGAAPNDMVGIVFSTPLSRVRERAAYRASKHLREQADLRLQQKQELILREVSDALHNARSARDRVQATQRAREYAQAALEAEERKLAGGTSSLFFVLQLQSDLADVETAEVRARADYNKAVSQLHFAEGSLLERSSMVIKLQ